MLDLLTDPTVGFLLTIIGVVLTAVSLARRQPRIRVLYRVSELTSLREQALAVRVAFWNAGRDAIRSTDVHRTLKIVTQSGAGATGTRVVEVSNDNTNVRSSIAAKQVIVEWRHLNPQDGAVLDVVYGDSSALHTPVELDVGMIGEIVGGGAPTRRESALVLVTLHFAALCLSWAIIIAGLHASHRASYFALVIAGGAFYPLAALRWHRRLSMRLRLPGSLADAFALAPHIE